MLGFNFKSFFILTGVTIIWLSCQKESSFTPVYEVDEDLQPLVDLFLQEASDRGVNLEMDNLILQYDPELASNLCGQCNSLRKPDELQKEIRVNKNTGCWDYPQELEALIFHEFGHCILGRPHLPDTLPNGDPKSMMVESNLLIYAPCRYVFGQVEDCNNVHKRAYYLDELFNASAPVPDWAK